MNLGVVIWGAFVRATGSGAGCGSHWPLCNGEVIPRPDRIETLIEFIHRGTSGVVFIGVGLLLIWAWRLFRNKHPIFWGAFFAMVFMVIEALVGAGLVLFDLVEDNDSIARAITGGIHLINTFLLLACLSVTAWWASGGKISRPAWDQPATWLLGIGLLGLLIVGMSGAVTALGDTLYPSTTLSEGIQQDFSSTSHFLIRLRVLHPMVAILVSLYLITIIAWLRSRYLNKTARYLGFLLPIIIIIQILAGFVNVYLLAPVWMQLIHLFLSNSVWITTVLFTVSAITKESEPALGLNKEQLASMIGRT